jgi:DNA repair protein SbcD/Mre11
MFRFLHAADIHLDSPLVGLERYEAAPVAATRSATRRAFENMIQLAIDEQVAFVVLAGDLYDGDSKDYNTGLFFVEQMAKLDQAGIDVFVVAGNHDFASNITKHLRPPKNVRFFATKNPETHVLESLQVAIHGQGFASRAVSEDLAAGYPARAEGIFNLGLLHTSLDGRVGHGTYAPTSVAVLAQKGYQYWALGHVHKREVVSQDPWIVFPGNLQGRHARETGAKSCTLVTVENGIVKGVEERSVDVMRWAECRVAVDACQSVNDVLDFVETALQKEAELSEGRMLAVRVKLNGTSPCYHELKAKSDHVTNEIRGLALRASAAEVWIEKVQFLVSAPQNASTALEHEETKGGLLAELANSATTPEEMAALREALVALKKVLPAELTTGPDALDLESDEFLLALAADARDLLLARVTDGGVAK